MNNAVLDSFGDERDMKVLTNLFKGIGGGIAIMFIFAGIVTISDEKTRSYFSLIYIILGSLFFLILSGNVKRPYYFFVIPSMLIPFIINCYIVQFDSDKGIVLCTLIFVFGITSTGLVRRYYLKRECFRQCGKED